jgi:hypothetical protein
MSDTTKASFKARVIAGGVDGERRMFRATLALLPMAVDGPEFAELTLAEWPREIDSLFETPMHIIVSPVVPVAPGVRPKPVYDRTRTIAVAPRHRLNEADLQTVVKVWKYAVTGQEMPGDDDARWAHLLDALAPASPTARPGRDVSSSKVYPTGRSDAALLYTIERAQRIADTIRGTAKRKLPGPQGDAPVPWDSSYYDPHNVGSVAAQMTQAVKNDDEKQRQRIANDTQTAQDQATKQTNDRRDYLKPDIDLDTAIGILKSAKANRVSGLSAECTAAGDGDPDASSKRVRALHESSTLQDTDLPNNSGVPANVDLPPDEILIARRRLFALQTHPTLARLLHLVVDVEGPLDQLPASLSDVLWCPDPGSVDGEGEPSEANQACFLFAASDFGARIDSGTLGAAWQPSFWSIIKARRLAAPGVALAITHFWPCTREEMEIRASGKSADEMFDLCAVAQIDGVLDLGMKAKIEAGNPCVAEGLHTRYDLISVDSILATEGDVRRANWSTDQRNTASRTGVKSPDPTKTGFAPRPSLVSGGLALIDRWRQHQVVAEIVTGSSKYNDHGNKRPILLDAEDLTIGYKIDVGVRARDRNDHDWRSLMNRTISMNMRGIVLDPLIAKLIPGEEERARLESGLVAPASRQRVDDTGTQVHAEEIVASWEGDPLGLACQSSRIGIDSAQDIPISRTYDLYRGDNVARYLPYPLRFGWPYRMGVRATYLGGGALRLRNAVARYEGAYKKRLALPALSPSDQPSTDGRRFLRQEAIAAPIVLMTEQVAAQADPMPRQSALVVTVRTCTIDKTRARPRTTQRVVLPPRIELAFAAKHGVFDRNAQLKNVRRPPGGLKNVDFDAPWGEFPIFASLTPDPALVEQKPGQFISQWGKYLLEANGWLARSVSGPQRCDPMRRPFGESKTWTWGDANDDFVRRYNDGEFIARNWKATDAQAFQQKIDAILAGTGKSADPIFLREGFRGILRIPLGEPVFRHRKAPGPAAQEPANRRTAYYPDPAATSLIVAVRRAGRSSQYLDGRPLEVPLYGPAGKFPDIAPVTFNFEAQENPRGFELKQSDVVSLAGVQNVDVVSLAGVQNVNVSLHPGEHFKIDLWCVPSQAQLTGWFDAIETLSIHAFAQPAAAALPSDFEKAVAGLTQLVGGDVHPTVAAGFDVGAAAATKWYGPSGISTGGVGIKPAAKLVRDFMLKSPLPDIAAVQTIDAVHAVDKPVVAPKFPFPAPDSKKSSLTTVVLARVDPADREKQLTAAPANWDLSSWGTTSEGLSKVVFGGQVWMDRVTSATLELRAECVSPRSTAFDDPKRSRTREDRQRGLWPVESGKKNYKKAAAIFGFDKIGPYGEVSLPRRRVTLLRFERIVETGVDENFDLAGEQLRALTADPDQNPCSVSEPDPMTDTLARQLTLRLVETTRYQPLLTRPGEKWTPVQENGDDSLQDLPLTRSSNERQLAGQESAEGAEKSGHIFTIWLPAARRPDRLATRTIEPSFIWTEGVENYTSPAGLVEKAQVKRRIPLLRIYVERPWFSSGEGERLGIVLWPPGLLDLSNNDICENIVARENPLDPVTNKTMDLSDFDDLDLGPGGAFVTRWGADPIRGGPGPEGVLMPPHAFSDRVAAAGLSRAIFVSKAMMPIPQPDKSSAPTAALTPSADGCAAPASIVAAPTAGASEKPQWLQVALLTYEPYFDVDQERWFVDVALDPFDTVEPFVRLGLVRYQEHAPSHLQVSEPVVEWAQILPRRTLRVVVGAKTSTQGWPIRVDVLGGAALRGKDDGLQRASVTPHERLPRMRISLREAVTSAAGVATETDVKPEILVDASPAIGLRGADGREWSTTFYLDEDPRPNDKRQFIVSVEEIEEFAPSSYEHEPVTAEEAKKAKPENHGPRYAARLEITA